MTLALALQLLPYVFAAATGGVAIWQNRKKNTAEKIRDTLILGIEQATALPQTQDTEKIIKTAIYARAVLAGVQPALKPLVEDLTAGPPDDEERETRRAIERFVASRPPAPADDSGADRT